MMTSKDPQIGDQYRSVGSAFRNAAWVLTEIFKSRDGIDHARLTSTHDATECRTLALSVVADTRRFTLAEAPNKPRLTTSPIAVARSAVVEKS